MPPAKTRATKPSNEPPAECPKCGGYGYIIDEATITARPCDCPAYTEMTLRRRQTDAGVPARFSVKTFEGFEVPKGEKDLGAIVQMARSYASGFNRGEKSGILMRGVPGCGKTHLAVSILHVVVKRGYSARYENFSDLLSKIRDTFNRDSEVSEGDLLEDVDNADLLVLDDLGAEMTSDWVRDRLYLILNRRYENARPVIITTNCSEHELAARVGERIASRLYEMCDLPIPEFPAVDWRKKNLR
ncbi:ATP-binding protein [bacterium]|nr:ATP-binding protein [bacterium]